MMNLEGFFYAAANGALSSKYPAEVIHTAISSENWHVRYDEWGRVMMIIFDAGRVNESKES